VLSVVIMINNCISMEPKSLIKKCHSIEYDCSSRTGWVSLKLCQLLLVTVYS
jgi:hypothetical protein